MISEQNSNQKESQKSLVFEIIERRYIKRVCEYYQNILGRIKEVRR